MFKAHVSGAYFNRSDVNINNSSAQCRRNLQVHSADQAFVPRAKQHALWSCNDTSITSISGLGSAKGKCFMRGSCVAIGPRTRCCCDHKTILLYLVTMLSAIARLASAKNAPPPALPPAPHGLRPEHVGRHEFVDYLVVQPNMRPM